MPESDLVYTYRGGQRIALRKRPDQFVVRLQPEAVRAMGVTEAERVSSASTRVTIPPSQLEPLMAAARGIAPAHHAYERAGSGDEFLITDRVFVTFHDVLAPDAVDAFAGEYGLIKRQQFGERDYLFELTNHTGMNPVKLVVKLTEEDDRVAAADHDLNQRMTRYAVPLPADPAYARQWHLHTRFNHADFDPRSSARCEAAWQLLDHMGSPDVVVGVTDDGCRTDHPDLNSTDKFAGWGYFRGTRLVVNTDIDAQQSQMYVPGADHGTACAAVIAGESDGLLTVGAAPGCKLFPIQWESQGPYLLISDSKLLTALNHVADKVDVLSNSWGSTPVSEWALPVINRITQLATAGGRRGSGIVFLWAAGNENCPIQHTTTIDTPYDFGWEQQAGGSWAWVGVSTSRQFSNNLVGIPGLMHIGALASTAQRSHYSNYGTGVLLCAPTNNVHEYYRLTVRGLGITTASGVDNGVTDDFGGTSSATPLVAGIAALTISANPALSALEVVSILKRTASKDLNMQAYPRTPPASYDPNPIWDVSPIPPFDQGTFQNIGSADGTWSPWFGHGCVDAPAAVAEALGGVVPPQPGETLSGESSPALPIPDNNSTGVRNAIALQSDAKIATIEVEVEITHTYVGDLRITLITPSGATVPLHNRNGGSSDNIHRTYDIASTPGLAALVGTDAGGSWILHVQDLAAADNGTLARWAIRITTAAAGSNVNGEESPGVTIPDNNPAGIERVLTFQAQGTVQDLEVAVDITHSYIGDLRVALVAPDNTSVALHSRTGGSADNIIREFTPATTPALSTLRGRAIAGSWRLQVADLAGADVGKLNHWALRITPAA